MNKIFKKGTICLDMVGCPNNCKHCWIGKNHNGDLKIDDLLYVRDEFKKVITNLDLHSWYKEPDYHKYYKDLYKIEINNSITHKGHFELISFYRAVRDKEYIPWLSSIGLKKAQLTFFGMEKSTNYYVGRKTALLELIETINLLLENKIAPRIQIFTYKDNIDELNDLLTLFNAMNLEERCKEIGQEFNIFTHQGSAIGLSMNLVDNWITTNDLEKIPEYLKLKTFEYFNTNTYENVFGFPEKILYDESLNKNIELKLVVDEPVFYIDKDFNVYPNHSEVNKYWLLGNLKEADINDIIKVYLNNESIAQKVYKETPFKEMVLECGNPERDILFLRSDYYFYILEKYLKKKY